MKPRDFTAPSSINEVGIQWIGRHIAIFDDADGTPIAKGNFSVIAEV